MDLNISKRIFKRICFFIYRYMNGISDVFV